MSKEAREYRRLSRRGEMIAAVPTLWTRSISKGPRKLLHLHPEELRRRAKAGTHSRREGRPLLGLRSKRTLSVTSARSMLLLGKRCK